MKNVYFYDSNYNDVIVLKKNVNTEEEVFSIIDIFLKDHNYPSYYINVHKNDKGIMSYDFGSWSQFIFWGETEIVESSYIVYSPNGKEAYYEDD